MKKNKKNQKVLNFKQSALAYPYYFLPLVAFIPAYWGLMGYTNPLNHLVFFLGFFTVATLAFNAVTKTIIKVNHIQIIIYQSNKVQTKTIYLEDIDYITYIKPNVVIYTKLNNQPTLCSIRKKDRSRLAAFLNQKHIQNQLQVDSPSTQDWQLLL